MNPSHDEEIDITEVPTGRKRSGPKPKLKPLPKQKPRPILSPSHDEEIAKTPPNRENPLYVDITGELTSKQMRNRIYREEVAAGLRKGKKGGNRSAES